MNLLDEAEKQGVLIDLDALSRQLGVPVTGACARDGKGLRRALEAALSAARAEDGSSEFNGEVACSC